MTDTEKLVIDLLDRLIAVEEYEAIDNVISGLWASDYSKALLENLIETLAPHAVKLDEYCSFRQDAMLAIKKS